MTGLTASDAVKRNDDIVETDADGEVVALNVGTGDCYGLNKVGSRIWALIAQPTRIDEICAALVREYDVDEATCEQQVLELLEALRAAGMIMLHEEAAATTP